MRLIFFFFFLMGCSGYRFTQQENPLAQYGIQTLSIPMFYNYSNLPDVSGDFTRETYLLLTGFSGLKIISGYDKNSDAVLIGILKTPEKVTDTLRPTNLTVAKNRAKNAIESRGSRGRPRDDFYIPGSTNVSMYLQVILIKKPSEEELALLKSGIGDKINFNSKIMLNELLPVQSGYAHEVLDNQGVDVIGTQNAGVQRKTLKNMAEQAAISVRDMILYAF